MFLFLVSTSLGLGGRLEGANAYHVASRIFDAIAFSLQVASR